MSRGSSAVKLKAALGRLRLNDSAFVYAHQGRWDEAEECIDPQSELLRTHSPVPGRYFAYEYSDASQPGDRALPRGSGAESQFRASPPQPRAGIGRCS